MCKDLKELSKEYNVNVKELEETIKKMQKVLKNLENYCNENKNVNLSIIKD